MAVDPFEEFEFKPLTEGLGFHKKKESTATPAIEFQASGLDMIHETTTTPEKTSELFNPPLPRKRTELKIEEKKTPNPSAVDDILSTLNKRRLDVEIEENREALKRLNKKENIVWTTTTANAGAIVLDSMLITASGLLCMIILLMVTKVDLVANIADPDQYGMIYLATWGVFAMTTFVYSVVNRMFLGYTPGEWAFEQRVGRPDDLKDAFFPIQLALRSIIVIASGWILMPIISYFTGRDYVGEWSGAQLFKKG